MDEVARVEQRYGFEFADDHRAFLHAGLAIGDRWPDWRHGTPEALRERLDRPVDGVLFDVEHNAFWYEGWGERPATTAAAVTVARAHLSAVPRLVPVYAHRYLPAGRGTYGHPVLSVSQTDIICYGRDLVDYVDREFGGEASRGEALGGVPPERATVAFWRDLVS